MDTDAACQACTVDLDQIRRPITILGQTAQSDLYVEESSMENLVELFRIHSAATDAHADRPPLLSRAT